MSVRETMQTLDSRDPALKELLSKEWNKPDVILKLIRTVKATPEHKWTEKFARKLGMSADYGPAEIFFNLDCVVGDILDGRVERPKTGEDVNKLIVSEYVANAKVVVNARVVAGRSGDQPCRRKGWHPKKARNRK